MHIVAGGRGTGSAAAFKNYFIIRVAGNNLQVPEKLNGKKGKILRDSNLTIVSSSGRI